jgi:hypothetical protein
VPDSARRFQIQFPVVTMRENLGGKRALVIVATQPPGADLVLATCMDIDGKLHGNVPFQKNALMYAFQHNKITLVEVDGSGLVAPSAGLVDLMGKPLR